MKFRVKLPTSCWNFEFSRARLIYFDCKHSQLLTISEDQAELKTDVVDKILYLNWIYEINILMNWFVDR